MAQSVCEDVNLLHVKSNDNVTEQAPGAQARNMYN